MPPIGSLDRRITIRRDFGTVAEGFNEHVADWQDLVTVWAKRTDASASEAYRAQEIGAQISARFTVRYSPVTKDVNPKDRILFDDREYNITGVREPDGTRNQWIEIDAVARSDT